MSPVATLSDVSRTFESRNERIEAIRRVSLSLDSSSLTALVGPSGSGKTTLINLIVGWEIADSGSVVLDPGVSDDWSGIAVVPQGIGLITELSLIENIELPTLLGNPQSIPTDEIMNSLGLDGLGLRTPEELSMGEQQRGSIARAVVAHPALLVADEPTAHQDEQNVHRIMEVLVSCARGGSAVLVATHDERTLDYFDTVLGLRDGSVSENRR